ncbi:cysteine proteinase [Pluteus cervinus]|uniref:Cysteine proteinase n=1 Tax=Pluteus cervinus TaxID=181527 RepID=A0ACD3BF38_9AGAR|nr:cysteine proteinase [Pluteus cervinus]
MAPKKSKKKAPTTTAQDIPAIDNDNEDPLDDLLAQLDARDSRPVVPSKQATNEDANQAESHRKQDAKERFKARQARKAAQLAENYVGSDAQAEAELERSIKEENEDIARSCRELNLRIHEIEPDGHCLFSAIADQLVLAGILHRQEAKYSLIRAKASDYIRGHQDDFLPFLPSPDPPKDINESGLMTPKQFDQYCTLMRNTAVWGGEPEIVALSRAFKVRIQVIQAGKPPVVVHEPPDFNGEPRHTLHLSYHKRLYGLGEHYNSLKPISGSVP